MSAAAVFQQAATQQTRTSFPICVFDIRSIFDSNVGFIWNICGSILNKYLILW